MKTKTKPKTKKAEAKNDFAAVVKLIKKAKTFVLTTHVNPDGDGLGAQSALYLALRKMGKKVFVVNHDALPHKFTYLGFTSAYQVADKIPPHDVCLVMDAGNFTRIREGVKREEFKTLVNIDHHYSNDRYGDLNLVYPEASATGEIVYKLIKALKVKVDKGIAEAVYTSIVTDTGRFRFPSATPDVFRMAAELLEAGADGPRVCEGIFGDITKEAMELTHLALGSIKTHNDGRIGSITLSRADFLKSGALDEDTENLINLVRNLNGVEVAFFLKELPDGRVKLSMRSKSKINVADLAGQFGGGGHAYASGAVMPGPLDQALKAALSACQAAIQ